MKILILTFCLSLGYGEICGQEGTFSLKVDKDTLLMHNYLEITFTMENLQGDFIPPDLKDFYIVAGPNVSNQFSMINGQVTHRSTYTYFVEPVSPGVAVIPSAGLNDGSSILETLPLDIVVLPNPEGIMQKKGMYGFEQRLTFRDTSRVIPDSLRMKLKKVKTKKI